MKTGVVAVFLMTVLALPAHAQSGGGILLFSDNPGFSDCTLHETVFVSNYVYVVHMWMPEASSAYDFNVDVYWDNVAVGPVDPAGNLLLGDIYTNASISYYGCQELPHLLAILEFVPLSETPPCGGELWVTGLEEPFSGGGGLLHPPKVVDCGGNVLNAQGGRLMVNEDLSLCYPEAGNWCSVVGTESTTWGEIKALYR